MSNLAAENKKHAWFSNRLKTVWNARDAGNPKRGWPRRKFPSWYTFMVFQFRYLVAQLYVNMAEKQSTNRELGKRNKQAYSQH